MLSQTLEALFYPVTFPPISPCRLHSSSSIHRSSMPSQLAAYFASSGYKSSFRDTLSSSRSGLSSSRYWSYWPLFSTFALIPIAHLSVKCSPQSPPNPDRHIETSVATTHVPSKIRTAVGKSLTLLAAFNAAVSTDGAGTRSYAKALFRLRCCRGTR